MARRGALSDSSDNPNAEVELELPDAMRIWKQRHSRSYRNLYIGIKLTSLISRFHSILYNSEAIKVQENADLDNSSNSIFLHPLAFDAEVSLYSLTIPNRNLLFCSYRRCKQ
jgi:hypothetical protein